MDSSDIATIGFIVSVFLIGGVVGYAIGNNFGYTNGQESVSCPKIDCPEKECPKVGMTKCEQIIRCDSTDLAKKCIDLMNDAETVKNLAKAN